MKVFFFALIGSVFLLLSCEKQYTVEKHSEAVVTGNTAGTPDWVSEVQMRGFLYRLSLDLIGDQPDEDWLEARIATLKSADFSVPARQAVISELIADEQFSEHFFQLASDWLVEGLGRRGFTETRATYVATMQQFENNGQQLEADFFRAEIARIDAAMDSDSLLIRGEITLEEFVVAFLDNPVYDEINMGTVNFVVSCFQHVLGRYPTELELESSREMVDGGNAVLFTQNGNTKGDFLKILSASPEFSSGIVYWAELLWLRQNVETDLHWFWVNELRENQDFEQLINAILSSQYYAAV